MNWILQFIAGHLRGASCPWLLIPLLWTQTLCAQKSTPQLVALKSAAEKGNAEAQSRLGDVYRDRLDSQSALVWYRKAASQGIVHAQSEAGRLLIASATSPTAKPDTKVERGEEAVMWLLKSANMGDQAAQVELGRQYQTGKFIKQDQIEAYKWFTLAAKSSNPLVPKELEAKWALDALILKLTQEQIAEGQNRAKSFTPHQITSADIPEPSWVKEIRLQGLSGAEDRQLAVINGHSFRKGDRADIKVSGRKVEIQCLDIQSNAVTIQIEGLSQPGELKLSSELPNK